MIHALGPRVLLCLLPLVTLIGSSAAAGVQLVVFEKEYVRTTGAPTVVDDNFPAVEGTAAIEVTNAGVSSATVKINGVVVFAPKDFNQGVSALQATVELKAANQISVELRGAPRGTLRLILTQFQDLQPVVYYLSRDGTQLRRLLSDGTDELVTNTPGHCSFPAVSASGLEVALPCDNQALWVLNTDGSGAYKVVDAPWCQTVEWLAGDTEIAYDGDVESGIYRISPAGAARSLWVAHAQFAPFGRNDFRNPGIVLSADRTRFAANVGVASAGDNEIFVGRFEYASGTVTDVRRLSPRSSSWTAVATGVAIAADGGTVFYGWADNSSGVMSLRRVAFDGTDEEIIRQGSWGFGSIQLSPDGQRVWFWSCDSADDSHCVLANTALDGSDYQEVPTAVIPGPFDLAQP